MEENCGLSGQARFNHEDLYKRNARGSKAEKDVNTEAKAGALSYADGSQGMQTVSSSWQRQGTGFPPRTFRSKVALPTHFGPLTSITARQYVCVVLSQENCGNLVQQQQETNTQSLLSV